MKKFILFLIFGLMLCSYVAATDFPMIVSGKVNFNGVTYSNQKVEIYSPRLNYKWETFTNEDGIYMVVFNNLVDSQNRKLINGDQVYIDACPVDVNSECRRTVTVSTDPIDVSWGIDVSSSAISPGAVDVTTIPATPVCGSCNCATPQCNCAVCPAEKVCPVTTCATCTIPECPKQDNGYLTPVIVGLLALVAGGGAAYVTLGNNKIKVYKKSGVETIYHQHPTISGYHDPKTKHSAVPHKIGELLPKYKKNEVGNWVYTE
jgi:hypothetical protein